MRGRKPKPTKQLKLAGSWRADTRPDEPQPDPIFPDPPNSLPAAVKKVWLSVKARCEALNYITTVDGDLLLGYCNAKVQLDKAIKREDDKAMRDWSDRLFKYGAEFGFSPSSRTRCRAVKKDTEKGGRVGFSKTG